MPIPFKLEYVIERAQAEQENERRLLQQLAGVRLSPDEARTLWPRVLDHKWYISERLGRDVGLRVAAIDYFENIWTPRTPPAPKRSALLGRLRRHAQPLTLNA
jgi:hypothetical protein